MQVEPLSTRSAVLSYVREAASSATSEVILGITPEMLSTFESLLKQARDNGAFTVLCLYGDPEQAALEYDFSEIATVVRAWDMPLHAVLHVDQREGAIIPLSMFDEEKPQADALRYETPMLYNLGFPQFLAQQWNMGDEIYVTEPTTLPHECGSLREATLHSTLHLRDDNKIGLTAEVRDAPASPSDEFRTFEGQVVSTRQNFVHPATSMFFGQMTLIVRSGEQRATMGGIGAYVEDLEARNMVLRPTV